MFSVWYSILLNPWLLAQPPFTSECHHLVVTELGHNDRNRGFIFSLARRNQILPQSLFSLGSLRATSENIHKQLVFSLLLNH